MTSTIQLRDYQQQAVSSLFSYFSHNKGNPVLVLPTGAGKSVILGAFIKKALSLYSETRILILTHVKELIEQDHQALLRVWPQASSISGINSASIGQRSTNSQILFAGIQSIYTKAMELGRFDLVIVDEAHLISPTQTSMYQSFFHDAHLVNPHIKIIGLTATPYRLKDGLIIGEDGLFDDIAFEVTIQELISWGYLSRLTTKGGKRKVDLSGVGVRGGEYIQKDLEAALSFDVTEAALQEVVERGQDRKSWLIFCVSVDHAERARDILRDKGIICEAVHGGVKKKKREQILKDFKSGKIRAITNCMVLTTGFDAPQTDLLALLRPTKSAGLYVQMVGRGMRVADGKEDCLVLDFAHCIETHGPVDSIRVRRSAGEDGARGEVRGAPCRECPGCLSFVPISFSQCPDCGFEFPIDPKHEEYASEAAILSEPVWRDVERVEYHRHEKNAKTSMRVEYYGGLLRLAREWVCFEHSGGARLRAAKWWAERVLEGKKRAPSTVEEALEVAQVVGLREPKRISIDESGKWPSVVGYEF